MRGRGGAGRGVLLAGVAGAVVALDQWTKSWAQQSLAGKGREHVFWTAYFVLTYNRGAAFSLGSGVSALVEVVAVALALVVLLVSGRLAKGGGNLAALLGFALIGGGAVSNLADRVFRHHHGAVVDFVQVVSWWPIFNVADAAITLGAVTVAVSLVLFPRLSAPPRSALPDGSGGVP